MAAPSSYEALLPHPPGQQVFIAPPAQPTPQSEIIAALRTISALDGLAEEEYRWFAENGLESVGDDGARVFTEGTPCDRMIFILKGDVHIRRHHAGPVAFWVGRAGQMTGKLPYSRMKVYSGEAYLVGPGWSLQIHEDLFPEMLERIPSMTQRCVNTMMDRVREITRIEQQSEKLAALGKLAGNLAHELNNPASAAQRSASSLFSELRQYGDHKYRMGNLCLSEEETARYRTWVSRTRSAIADRERAGSADALAISDREVDLLGWLDAHTIPNPWAIAPALAETGVSASQLDELAAMTSPQSLPIAVATFASSLRVERMAETVVDSTVRIFDLIRAIKDYSYMDQAPIQDIDLAQSIENTLAMFKSRLEGIEVITDFDPALPPVGGYGRELNQVWTALIENAIEAMREGGTLRICTQLHGHMAFIEVWDSGPGIDPELKSRIFEPFYTTKAPGRGLGLGLDTVQRILERHSGYIHVESRPGATCFQVRLPVEQAQAY
jgi:signal transduction histidine kinase